MSITTGLLSDLLDLGPLYQLSYNWWNQDVSNWPIDARDAGMKSLVISDAGGITNARCHPDWGSSVGMPYCVADNSTSLVPFTPGAFNGDPASDFDYCTECDYGIGGLTGYPVPVEARTDARYMENGEYDRAPGNTGDAHLLIIQKDTGVLYELSYASPISGGKWHAGAGAIFDLNANDRRPDDWTSTDAAGLAVLPGLMRYDEIVILTDPINHAFRTRSGAATVTYGLHHTGPERTLAGRRWASACGSSQTSTSTAI